MDEKCVNCAPDPNCEIPVPQTDGDCAVTTPPNEDRTPPPTSADNGCVIGPNGLICPPAQVCSPWDLTESPEACLIDRQITESIEIGGAVVNVHKLLGIHEQGSLEDVTGSGTPLFSSQNANYPAKNAFDKLVTEWRSLETGPEVVKKAFIGYDFGEIKLKNGRNRFGIETLVKKDISRIRIKQGCDSKNRATKIRVERSNDGVKWFGVSVFTLEDCDGLLTLDFSRSVPSRWWRIRPVQFNGSVGDYWAVQAIQMIEYEATHISNIQDKIFLENRDRHYDEFSKRLKAQYTPVDTQSLMKKYGIGLDEIYTFEFSFSATVNTLGRPIVIGDIFQLPSETQFTASLKPVLKYLEVTDVTWSTNGYTPTWQPLIVKVTAEPLIASQETQNVIGKQSRDHDIMGLADNDDGRTHKAFQDWGDVDQTISANANTQVPVKGDDYADITKFSQELLDYSVAHPEMKIERLDRHRNIFARDAMPPNGLPYTQGDEFPINPKNGDYHRLTYEKVGAGLPVRLYKYSSAKSRWIYLETDLKEAINDKAPFIQEFLSPKKSSQTPIDKIPDAF